MKEIVKPWVRQNYADKFWAERIFRVCYNFFFGETEVKSSLPTKMHTMFISSLAPYYKTLSLTHTQLGEPKHCQIFRKPITELYRCPPTPRVCCVWGVFLWSLTVRWYYLQYSDSVPAPLLSVSHRTACPYLQTRKLTTRTQKPFTPSQLKCGSRYSDFILLKKYLVRANK